MTRQPVSEDAQKNPKQFYDARYQSGYMQDFTDVFEACRVYTVRRVLKQLKENGFSPRTIVDYGCGEGRYLSVLRDYWPQIPLIGCDISDLALRIAAEHHEDVQLISMGDETVSLPDGFADLVTSVEVIEHVQSAERAASEMARLLRPGGILLLTTPCANAYSLEWFFNRFTGGLEPSSDGYGRFATDEPGHLRRLTDRHVHSLFEANSVEIFSILHRAHVFTTLVWKFEKFLRFLPAKLRTQLALLDWHLFKHFPNGATMMALGKKV